MLLQGLILIVIASLFYFINKKISSPKKINPVSKTMIKCNKCCLNLLESEALKYDEDWYCSKEHLPGN